MSFETIRIYRDMPIINKYLALPPNREEDKNVFFCSADCTAEVDSIVSGAQVIGFGKSCETGSKHGGQKWLRLPSITPDTWYTTDVVQDLANAGNIVNTVIDVGSLPNDPSDPDSPGDAFIPR